MNALRLEREPGPVRDAQTGRREIVVLWLFAAYKRWLGPVLHAASLTRGGCCYQPSCSEYAALAVAQHGLLRGGALAVGRILRCNPFSRGGWDPVPGVDAGKLSRPAGWTFAGSTPKTPVAGNIEVEHDSAHLTRRVTD